MIKSFKKAWNNIKLLSSVLLLVIICISVFSGCSTKDKDYLYNWLLENGELVNNTELIYKDNTFTLNAKSSKKIFVEYKTINSDGYEITVQLPLYSKSEKVSTEISVESKDASSSLTYYHTANSFTRKTPIEYGSTSNYPPLNTITIGEYRNGEYIPPDKNQKEENKRLQEENEKIKALHTIHEDIAKGLSHESLCTILDWLNEEICPLAKMEISDLGYKAYK